MDKNAFPKLGEVGVGHQPEPSLLAKRKRSPSAAGGGERQNSEIADGDEQPLDGLPSVALSDPTVLDCSICHDPLSLPVFECENGHIICSSCVESSKQKCPSCSQETGNIHRCRSIERVLESIKVPCFYKSYGCPKQFSYSSKSSHEVACAYAPFVCPSADCTFIGCERIMTQHITKQQPKLGDFN